MDLQFSIFGYIIMAIFYSVAMVVLISPLHFLMRKWRGRWIVLTPIIVIVIALPWADEVWIAWHFHKYCQDAGVHVYHKVRADGYVDETSPSPRPPDDPGPRLLYNDPKRLAEFDRHGYRYFEDMFKDGGVWHVERQPDGVYVEILDQPTGRYRYRYSANNVDMGLQILKQEWEVVDSKTGKVLGKETIFKRYPNIVEGTWLRFFGVYPTICMGSAPNPKKARHLLVNYVLVPNHKE